MRTEDLLGNMLYFDSNKTNRYRELQKCYLLPLKLSHVRTLQQLMFLTFNSTLYFNSNFYVWNVPLYILMQPKCSLRAKRLKNVRQVWNVPEWLDILIELFLEIINFSLIGHFSFFGIRNSEKFTTSESLNPLQSKTLKNLSFEHLKKAKLQPVSDICTDWRV